MIINFEEFTHDLTDEEKKLVPIIIQGLYTKRKDNPIKGPEIVARINEQKAKYGLKNSFSEVRLRKICNFIRTAGILPLIATSKGYFLSYDREEIEKQTSSLYQRAGAIIAAAEGLEYYMRKHPEKYE